MLQKRQSDTLLKKVRKLCGAINYDRNKIRWGAATLNLFSYGGRTTLHTHIALHWQVFHINPDRDQPQKFCVSSGERRRTLERPTNRWQHSSPSGTDAPKKVQWCASGTEEVAVKFILGQDENAIEHTS